MSFKKQVILITGASSGFGFLTALRLARAGHIVWATMRDLSKAEALQEVLAKNSLEAFIRELDVTKPLTIKAVVGEIKEKHNHIDVLINNAGYGVCGFFEDLTDEQIRDVMDVNFFGVQHVCREVIPLMRQAKKGKIINISSLAGRVAVPFLSAYNSTKWALEAFSESLYYELSPFGIKVVLVEPGAYPTNIFTQNAHYACHFNDQKSPYFNMSQRVKLMGDNTIKKLKKDPEDIAYLIEKIINEQNPRLRYIPDVASWLRIWLQKVCPPPLIAFFYRRLIHAN